jgi:tetratricopeptide (TPR) repeat protein
MFLIALTQQNSGNELKTNLTRHHRLLQPTELYYKQLENQVISLITDEGIAMYTMLGRWYRYYQDDPKALAIIRRFAKQYRPADAVRWFTSDIFIYRFVNEMLRSGAIEMSHNMRFYIADLSTQLAELKCKQRDLMKGVKVLYRGLRQSTQELKVLEKFVDSAIVTKSFMSTSWDIKVALAFAGISQSQSDESQPLLIELKVDFDSPSVIAADISSLSKFLDEREVLFDIGTKFRVETLTFDSSYKIWICQLSAPPKTFLFTKSLTTIPTEKDGFTNKASVVGEGIRYEHRRKFARATTRLKENELWSTRRTLPWIVSNSMDLARIWQQICFRSWQQGDIHQAKTCLENARTLYEQELIDENERAGLYAYLGFMLYKSGEYSRAIELAEQSLAMILRIEPANHLILARHYRILGLTYETVGRIKDALACHDQALIIDENLRSTEKWSMALTLRNFALIHRDRGDPASAAEYFTKAWIVFQEVSTSLLELRQ